MCGYRALFVGEPKVKKTFWRSRDHAAACIVKDGLSVIAVYETEDGTRFYDKSADIAELVSARGSLPANVQAFVDRARVASKAG